MVPHDATPESCWVGVSFPQWGESHVKAKLVGGNLEQSLLSTSSCPHGLALTPWLLPAHPRSFPPQSGTVSLQMATPSSDAAGRTGQDTCVFSLLWKEAEGCEGGSWVPVP